MPSGIKKKIIKNYLSKVDSNIDDVIRSLQENIDIDPNLKNKYKNLLKSSSEIITQRWEQGTKYLRTEFVAKAFNKYYPAENLDLSIHVDSMINILDDMLDENSGKDEKVLYILEYLRVFSQYCASCPNSKIQKNMYHYFNKLIALAVYEEMVKNLIKEKNSIDEILELSLGLLLIRAKDIDVFVEIALDASVFSINDSEILVAARVFRALNILKKDIFDIKHDRENMQETVVTCLIDKNDFNMNKYYTSLISKLLSKAEGVANNKDCSKEKHFVLSNFYQMMLSDRNEIYNHTKIRIKE